MPASFTQIQGSRNSLCPCGSGRKRKRCCLAEDERVARAARFDEAVGRRIQQWSSRAFEEEVTRALERFAPERTMDDDDLQLFATWFHNDRQLAGGGTPAERYAARTDLSGEERATARRIASARLGLHRVIAVEPGRWLELEDLVERTRVRVRSDRVSRDAVRWDVVLGRLMDGEPPSLWGPARLFEPGDEPELLAELERLAGGSGASSGVSAPPWAVGDGALELMRFVPPRWSVEPSFFTLEGGLVAQGRATWRVRDAAAARDRLRTLGRLEPGEPLEIDITVVRDALVADRRELPPGAMVLEAGPIDDPDTVPIASLRLEGATLSVEAMSEERLDRAIEIVARDFGDLAELSAREVVPLEQALEDRRSEPERVAVPPPSLAPAEQQRLLEAAMTDRTRRWLDDAHPLLGDRTPREAVAGEHRAEVVRLVRALENGAERASRRGEPFADVDWIREELGIADELAA